MPEEKKEPVIKNVNVQWLYPENDPFCNFMPPIELQPFVDKDDPTIMIRRIMMPPCSRYCKQYGTDGSCLLARSANPSHLKVIA